jgi:hypothetical protein
VKQLSTHFAQSELSTRALAEINAARGVVSPPDQFIRRESGSLLRTSSVLIRRMFVNLIRSSNGIKIRLFQMLLFAFLLWAFMGRFGSLACAPLARRHTVMCRREPSVGSESAWLSVRKCVWRPVHVRAPRIARMLSWLQGIAVCVRPVS